MCRVYNAVILRHSKWNKGEVHRTFSQFAPNIHKHYIFRYCINIVFILQENHINPSTFMLWIK